MSLEAALNDVRDLCDGSEPDSLHVLAAAARRVAEGTEWQVCLEHESRQFEDKSVCRFVSSEMLRGITPLPCRIVPAVLLFEFCVEPHMNSMFHIDGLKCSRVAKPIDQ